MQTIGIRWYLAVSGDGFFVLDDIDGCGSIAYVRDGTFALDELGYLCDCERGLALLAYPARENGSIPHDEPPQPIQIPYGHAAGVLTNIAIDADGTIEGAFTNARRLVVGRIALAKCPKAQECAEFGFACSGRLGSIEMGALERCNTPIAGGLTKLLLEPAPQSSQ
jgi:flagellar hook protein FlgE